MSEEIKRKQKKYRVAVFGEDHARLAEALGNNENKSSGSYIRTVGVDDYLNRDFKLTDGTSTQLLSSRGISLESNKYNLEQIMTTNQRLSQIIRPEAPVVLVSYDVAKPESLGKAKEFIQVVSSSVYGWKSKHYILVGLTDKENEGLPPLEYETDHDAPPFEEKAINQDDDAQLSSGVSGIIKLQDDPPIEVPHVLVSYSKKSDNPSYDDEVTYDIESLREVITRSIQEIDRQELPLQAARPQRRIEQPDHRGWHNPMASFWNDHPYASRIGLGATLGVGGAGIGIAALGELEALGLAGTLGVGAVAGFVMGVLAAVKYFRDHHEINNAGVVVALR